MNRRNIALVLTIASLSLAGCGATSGTLSCTPGDFTRVSLPGAKLKTTQLSREQASNAGKILATAKSLGLPDWVGVFAATVAYQETNLINLPGGDGSSVGLFQQLALYGSAAKRQDVSWATKMFLVGGPANNGVHIPGVVDMPNWQSYETAGMAGWQQLAEKVQRPAAGAYNSLDHSYANSYTLVTSALAQGVSFGKNSASAIQVGAPLNCTLPSGMSKPESVQTVMTAARSQIGVPYAWGDETPGKGFDCSGLTQWAMKQAGITLPRTAEEQRKATPSVKGVTWSPSDGQAAYDAAIAKLQPGDLVFLSSGGYAHHVGIYVGDGNILDAPSTGKTVQVRPLRGIIAASDVLTASRPLPQQPATDSGRPGQPSGTWQLPVARMVQTSPCGMRLHPILGTWRLHAGDDIGVPTGTPVSAVQNGVVESAGWDGGYGNRAVIRHADTQDQGRVITSVYAHLSSISVRPGQIVAKGDTIGLSGSTGLSTGPHLHFEIRLGDVPVKATQFVNSNGFTTISCSTSSAA